MGVLLGFGQIFEGVPGEIPQALKCYELDDGTHAVLLRESVKEVWGGALKLGASSLMGSHGFYLQEFLNVWHEGGFTEKVQPEWIVIPAKRRRQRSRTSVNSD